MIEETIKAKAILDTNILMGIKDEKAFFENYNDYDLMITLGTIKELDRLKTAEGKRGFEARNGLRIVRNNPSIFEILMEESEINLLEETVDNKIISFANEEGAEIVTNDLSMAMVSQALGVETQTYKEPADSFRAGYHEIELGQEMRDGENIFIHFNLLEDVRMNEYVIVRDFGYPRLIYKKTLDGYEEVKNPVIHSPVQFGKIKAMQNDPYQRCAIDALLTNQINIITGGAGSGKTFLCLAAQWAMMERGEIEGITIFVNPVKAKNAKEIGYYKGDKNMKLLQEGIGGVLASKLGGGNVEVIAGLMLEGKINILPVSDIRGYEVTGNRSLYITEAQNLDVELMKLALQRAEDCRVFIEGDPNTQLDGWMYEGSNNGMKRAIEVFSGEECFGTVALQNIYRSEIADIADRM